MKDERQAVFCLAGFCVFYAVFSGWAQDPTGPSNWWVSLANAGQVRMLQVKRETTPRNLHPQVFGLGRWVHIFIDISYLAPRPPHLPSSWCGPGLVKGLCVSLHFTHATKIQFASILSLANFYRTL